MLNLSLKRDSWHYKLAKFYNWREYDYRYSFESHREEKIPRDFCSYVRRLIFGTLAMILIGFVIGIAAVSLFYTQYQFLSWAFHSIMGGQFLPLGKAWPLAPIGLIVDVMVLTAFILYAHKKGWWRFPSFNLNLPSCHDIPYCEDTKRFFVAAYTMFHDKVCFRLEFRNGEEESDQ